MQHVAEVRSIMEAFAVDTGLSDQRGAPRRYLWTDAFAVCNFLELYRQTGEDAFLASARKLVDQVHFVLGRFSDRDSRRGWISGLGEQAGYEHPTAGGLRIGKKLLERKPEERFDERLEWDRDGQYFHYLTKWMQALTRIALATGDGRYQRLARELAGVAHAKFTYARGAGARRMYWKMSVDLARPLVASMGHHDPLDALITYIELEANSKRLGGAASEVNLEREIADCQAMCAGKAWATDDPLGSGSLLCDTLRLAQARSLCAALAAPALASLLADGEAGLEAFEASGTLRYPAARRLAFRELGLAIGLHAIDRLREMAHRHPGHFSVDERKQLARLGRFDQLREEVERFWLQKAHREAQTWQAHLDINAVMLATSLAPDGYLLACPREE